MDQDRFYHEVQFEDVEIDLVNSELRELADEEVEFQNESETNTVGFRVFDAMVEEIMLPHWLAELEARYL